MKNALIIITIVSEIYAVCVGDLNQNNVIDTLDIISLVNNIINNQIEDEISDMNYDNTTNILDVLMLVDIIIDEHNQCDIIWGETASFLPEYYFTADIDTNQINQII